MANSKISALTTKATPTTSDLTNILDAAAANADKKITLGSLPISTATQTALNAKEDVANKDTDGTLAANSDTKYASQKATKTYADGKISKDVSTTYTTNAIKTLTTAEYTALGTPDANTLYFIV